VGSGGVTSRTLLNVSDREQYFELVRSYKFPCTVNVTKGKDRTIEQNRLQRLWINEAAEQLGDETAEAKRAYCKLHFGVPLLRAESEDFCVAYDKYIRPLPYEQKLAFMAVPLDFPVTRLMSTRQTHSYLEEMRAHFTSLGVQLTVPRSEDEPMARAG
jgi:hypothetical protein